MKPSIVAFSDRVYRTLGQAYPPAFRERFSAEMAQVFQGLIQESYNKTGVSGVVALWIASLWDWTQTAITLWCKHLLGQRMVRMEFSSTSSRNGIRPLSAKETGAATLPFLLFGLSVILDKYTLIYLPPPQPLWRTILNPYLYFYGIILIGLGFALLRDFPRWAYAYLGWAILFAWWWTGMRFFGISWGITIWIPLVAVLLFSLLVRNSLNPLREILAGLRQDWTLFSLALYILYAYVFILYDENHHPFLLALIISTTLIISLAAWGYFRTSSPLRRVLALIGGLLLAAFLAGISNATWDYRAYHGLPESSQWIDFGGLILTSVMALIMLGNGLLARWRLMRNLHQKEI